MVINWQTVYQSLEAFLEANREIVIDETVVSVPDGVREDFYTAFNKVRKAFIHDYFGTLLLLSEQLSREYKQLEAEVISIPDFVIEIKLNRSIRWFIDDPLSSLIRPLYDLLFDLLKAKIDEESFKQSGIAEVETTFNNLFRTGYDKWVMLSMIKWLRPSDPRVMRLDKLDVIYGFNEIDLACHKTVKLPDLENTRVFSFDPLAWNTFAIPEVLFYSARLNKYVAIRSNFAEPNLEAERVDECRHWLPLTSLAKNFSSSRPWPSIMFYSDEKLDRISLIADYRRLCSPNLIVDTIPTIDQLDQARICLFKNHHNLLNPTSGTIIICPKEITEEVLKTLEHEMIDICSSSTEINKKMANAATDLLEQDAQNTLTTIAQDEPGTRALQSGRLQETSVIPQENEKVEPNTITPCVKLASIGFDQGLLAEALESVLCPKHREPDSVSMVIDNSL